MGWRGRNWQKIFFYYGGLTQSFHKPVLCLYYALKAENLIVENQWDLCNTIFNIEKSEHWGRLFWWASVLG